MNGDVFWSFVLSVEPRTPDWLVSEGSALFSYYPEQRPHDRMSPLRLIQPRPRKEHCLSASAVSRKTTNFFYHRTVPLGEASPEYSQNINISNLSGKTFGNIGDKLLQPLPLTFRKQDTMFCGKSQQGKKRKRTNYLQLVRFVFIVRLRRVPSLLLLSPELRGEDAVLLPLCRLSGTI